GGAVAALAASTLLTRDLGNEFLPQVDDGRIGIFVGLPPGSSAEETNRVVTEVEALVNEMPHVLHVFATAGGEYRGGSTNESAGRGSLDIQLAAPSARRDMDAAQWVQLLQQRIDERGFAGARIFVRPPSIRGLRTNRSGSAISVAVQGDDLE